jgi:uncharacterized membrane protein
MTLSDIDVTEQINKLEAILNEGNIKGQKRAQYSSLVDSTLSALGFSRTMIEGKAYYYGVASYYEEENLVSMEIAISMELDNLAVWERGIDPETYRPLVLHTKNDDTLKNLSGIYNKNPNLGNAIIGGVASMVLSALCLMTVDFYAGTVLLCTSPFIGIATSIGIAYYQSANKIRSSPINYVPKGALDLQQRVFDMTADSPGFSDKETTIQYLKWFDKLRYN